MCVPARHAQTDTGAMHRLMQAYPLATLVTMTADGLVANHLPLYLDTSLGPWGTLSGHVARANPVWQAFAGGASCLAVFQGPQAYITPSWYPDKATHGQVVPTWDYLAVHAHGQPVVIDDPAHMLALLNQLTNHQEARQSAPPWRVADAPEEYVARMMRAIVCFEMPIDALQARWKLEAAANRPAVSAGLAQRNHGSDAALAQWML